MLTMESTAPGTVLRLGSEVSELPGIGAARARSLGRMGVRTLSDLLRHLPMRYEREEAEGRIDELPTEGIGSARGVIATTRWVPMGGGRRGRFQATLEDGVDRLSLTWFNAGYLADKLHPGMNIRVQGKVALYGKYLQMVNPKWELLPDLDQAPAKQARIRPVYPASEDMPSAMIERLVSQALPAVLPQIIDPLPADLLTAHAMPSLPDAYRMAHQPTDMDQTAVARRRLAFNELLLLSLGIALKRHYNQHQLQAPALRWNPAVDAHLRQRFPFTLTPEQDQVIAEIAADMRQSRPMNRLLQGDVGSGKTVVALYAMLLAAANRRQSALMAPTELLAEQHFASIRRMLEGANVRLALLTASSDREPLLRGIESGEIDMVVGTQALLTETVRFNDLAVVIVDEQHRFGVLQRAAFRDRAAEGADKPFSPHYLVMTATPIPRTLSLTVFGDLDVSTIRSLPPGRTPITTRVVGQDKSDEVYRFVARRVAEGEQAYIVVPTIDAAGHESMAQLKNARAHVKLVQEKYLRGFRVEAVHGQLKSQTREATMARFRAGQTQALVATTVIEVGVDVPNATVMVVEHAERFGLAQLHQLRGRIGRGTSGRENVCVFIAEPTTEDGQKRMEAIAGTTDGFRIAEADLEIRGMGDFFGTRQHGLPPLRVARIPQDLDLLKLARRDAEAIVAADPEMTGDRYRLLRRVLLQHYGQTLGLIDVG